METGLSSLAERVSHRMAELGLTQADIARRGRFNATFVSDLLRGKKLTMRAANFARLARALITTEAYLRSGALPSESDYEQIAAEVGQKSDPERPALNAVEDSNVDLEIIGAMALAPHASAGSEKTRVTAHFPVYRSGGRFDGGSVVEAVPFYLQSLPEQTQAKNLYAVAISDDSMSPRYEPGDFVYVDTSVAVRRKDYVCIRVKGRSGHRDIIVAYIRQLLFLGADHIVVRQLSPSLETRYPISSVLGIHRAVLAGEALDELGTD